MLNNQSKQKLINSFNSMMTSLYNLKTDIAAEGKKAFIECDTQSINELMVLMTKVNEISNKVDKLAPSFKTYTLDIVTDTHPAVFPIGNAKSKISIKFPIKLTIQAIGNNITCHAESESLFTIKPVQTFYLKQDGLCSNTLKKLAKLSSTESITIINEKNNSQLVTINKEIKFKSANSLASFLLGKNIVNGNELLMVDKNKNYKTLLFERTIGS